MPPIQLGHRTCSCRAETHDVKLVALTGGPGGGKTAILEVAERVFCKHVVVLPEAAGIVFSGGFPRLSSDNTRRAAQRAIYYVQRELERLMIEEDGVAIILCDRGTVDGVAYWPEKGPAYWDAVGTTHEQELTRYHGVIHLETPDEDHGYNRENALRIESARTAGEIDAVIKAAWQDHPNRFVVPSSVRFLDKAQQAISHIGDMMPPCCA